MGFGGIGHANVMEERSISGVDERNVVAEIVSMLCVAVGLGNLYDLCYSRRSGVFMFVIEDIKIMKCMR